ncbi:ribbon-helix-helix domain-containing protein [Amycolatopsis endophytica]|uniref:DUF2191 domain-containing protein n=1 Tax=Amycolatopsis endophytica TaxID=860233 RepID=A0A853AWV5_9PSEU|nr:DUF2191 domain-containing protein [Amycolatopsis endophytica]NYI87152.1 hypothetical protein [Amycolatopsis endophytica]
MRTTVNIEDALLRDAKGLAARTGRSLGSVVEDALRVLLAEHEKAQRAAPEFALPTDGSGGLRPGVDLADKDAVAALLEDEHAWADAAR